MNPMDITVKPINLTDQHAALLQIWEDAFPDDAAFARLFLRQAMPPAEGWTCLLDGCPVSMAFLLPSFLHIRGTCCAARYVYAVSTLTDYRGHGCASALLRTAAQESRADLFYLYPATSEAERLYRKLGYRDFFRRRTADAGKLPLGPLLSELSQYPFSTERYLAYREKFYNNTEICWANLPESLLQMLLSQAKLLIFPNGFALMQETENACILSEVAAPETALPALLRTVQAHYPDKPVTARLPGGDEGAGMLLPLTDRGKRLTNGIQTLPFSGPLFDL